MGDTPGAHRVGESVSERRPRRLLCRHPGGPGWWALLALLVSSLAPLVHAEAAAWGATSTSLTRSAPVTLLSQHPDHCLICLAGQQWRAADLPGEARPVVAGPRSDDHTPDPSPVRDELAFISSRSGNPDGGWPWRC